MTRVTQEKMEEALIYLARTDDEVGPAKKAIKHSDRYIKTAVALASRQSDAKTVKDRENDAFASDLYKDACEAEAEAIERHGTLMAKRETAQTIIDTWRSVNASQRKNIT